MKWLGLLGLLVSAATSAYANAPADTPEPTQHEFVVKSFRTESGTVLPEARVVCWHV